MLTVAGVKKVRNLIKKEGITQTEFSKRWGITSGMLSQVLMRKKGFGWEKSKEIVRITEGEVTLDDLGWKMDAT